MWHFLWLYRCGIFRSIFFAKKKKKTILEGVFFYSLTYENPRFACCAVIYPRFLRNHQALSMLPLLHPWRFLAQQEIKFWGERLAVYRPLDWIAIRSAATPSSNKILINIQLSCHTIFLIIFYMSPQLIFKIGTAPVNPCLKAFLAWLFKCSLCIFEPLFIKESVKW